MSNTTSVVETTQQEVPTAWFLYTTLFACVILYFLFYSTRVLGAVASKLINTLALPKDEHITIGSMNIALIGGRLIFRKVRYTTKNACYRFVDGYMSIRWWRKEKRLESYVDANLAEQCRLLVHVCGLEVLLYNNTAKYDHLREVLEKRARDAAGVAAAVEPPTNPDRAPPQEPAPYSERNLPTLFRLFSAVGLVIEKGEVLIGNPNLANIARLYFEGARGVITTAPPRSRLDLYKSITHMELSNMTLDVIPNRDYAVREDENMFANTRDEDFLQDAMQSFNDFFADVKFAFLSTNKDDDAPRGFDKLRGKKKGIGAGARGIPTAGVSGFDPAKREAYLNDAEYARQDEVIQCERATMTYYADAAGPIPANDNSPALPPQWGVDVVFQDAILQYGPWVERQRANFMKFFMPYDYENVPLHVDVPGQVRYPAEFTTLVKFEKSGTIRIPFRQQSKDNEALDNAMGGPRKPAWIEFAFLNDDQNMESSSIFYNLPMLVHGDDGYIAQVEMNLFKCVVKTSLNEDPLLQSNKFAIIMEMHNPVVWNALYTWRILLDTTDPKIHLLRTHITLLQDMLGDFASGPPLDLAHFVPYQYVYQLRMNNFEIVTNVNEKNIIDNPSDAEENALIKFSGPRLDASIEQAFVKFQAPESTMRFDFNFNQLTLSLTLPKFNTINQYFLESAQNFIRSGQFRLYGTYQYHYRVDSSYLDSLVMNVDAKRTDVTLFGFYLRYFLFLRDNYFGYSTTSKTTDEHRRHSAETSTGKLPTTDYNDFELYLLMTIEDVTWTLPHNLYTIDNHRVSTVNHQGLTFELRTMPTYMDFYVALSPLVLTVPLVQEASLGPMKGVDMRERSFVRVNAVSCNYHRMYGPAPEFASYASRVKIKIGDVLGHLMPLQLVALSQWLSAFTFHLTDKDNALVANLVSETQPSYDVMMLQTGKIDVTVWGRTTATEVTLTDGVTMHSDSFITSRYDARTSIDLHTVVVRQLAAADSTMDGAASNTNTWREVASANAPIIIGFYAKSPNYAQNILKQEEYLRKHDLPTRRIPRIWIDEDNAEEGHSGSLRALGPTPLRRPTLIPPASRPVSTTITVPVMPAAVTAVPATPAPAAPMIVPPTPPSLSLNTTQPLNLSPIVATIPATPVAGLRPAPQPIRNTPQPATSANTPTPTSSTGAEAFPQLSELPHVVTGSDKGARSGGKSSSKRSSQKPSSLRGRRMRALQGKTMAQMRVSAGSGVPSPDWEELNVTAHEVAHRSVAFSDNPPSHDSSQFEDASSLGDFDENLQFQTASDGDDTGDDESSSSVVFPDDARVAMAESLAQAQPPTDIPVEPVVVATPAPPPVSQPPGPPVTGRRRASDAGLKSALKTPTPAHLTAQLARSGSAPSGLLRTTSMPATAATAPIPTATTSSPTPLVAPEHAPIVPFHAYLKSYTMTQDAPPLTVARMLMGRANNAPCSFAEQPTTAVIFDRPAEFTTQDSPAEVTRSAFTSPFNEPPRNEAAKETRPRARSIHGGGVGFPTPGFQAVPGDGDSDSEGNKSTRASSTTSVLVIDAIDKANIFVTPMFARAIEEWIELLSPRSPNIDVMLDQAQVGHDAERLNLVKHLLTKTQIAVAINHANISMLQTLKDATNKISKVYLTQLVLRDMTFFLSISYQHRSDVDSVSSPSGTSTVRYGRPVLDRLQGSGALRSVHAHVHEMDVKARGIATNKMRHSPTNSHPVVFALECDSLQLETNHNAHFSTSDKGTVVLKTGELHALCHDQAPKAITDIIEVWTAIVNRISSQLEAVYVSKRRQLQFLITELTKVSPSLRGLKHELNLRNREVGANALALDTGWRLLGHIRRCHKFSSANSRKELKSKLERIDYGLFDVPQLYNRVLENLDGWASALNITDLATCALITELFQRNPRVARNPDILIETSLALQSVVLHVCHTVDSELDSDVTISGISGAVRSVYLIDKANQNIPYLDVTMTLRIGRVVGNIQPEIMTFIRNLAADRTKADRPRAASPMPTDTTPRQQQTMLAAVAGHVRRASGTDVQGSLRGSKSVVNSGSMREKGLGDRFAYDSTIMGPIDLEASNEPVAGPAPPSQPLRPIPSSAATSDGGLPNMGLAASMLGASVTLSGSPSEPFLRSPASPGRGVASPKRGGAQVLYRTAMERRGTITRRNDQPTASGMESVASPSEKPRRRTYHRKSASVEEKSMVAGLRPDRLLAAVVPGAEPDLHAPPTPPEMPRPAPMEQPHIPTVVTLNVYVLIENIGAALATVEHGSMELRVDRTQFNFVKFTGSDAPLPARHPAGPEPQSGKHPTPSPSNASLVTIVEPDERPSRYTRCNLQNSTSLFVNSLIFAARESGFKAGPSPTYILKGHIDKLLVKLANIEHGPRAGVPEERSDSGGLRSTVLTEMLLNWGKLGMVTTQSPSKLVEFLKLWQVQFAAPAETGQSDTPMSTVASPPLYGLRTPGPPARNMSQPELTQTRLQEFGDTIVETAVQADIRAVFHLQSTTVKFELLPSLKAEYQMSQLVVVLSQEAEADLCYSAHMFDHRFTFVTTTADADENEFSRTAPTTPHPITIPLAQKEQRQADFQLPEIRARGVLTTRSVTVPVMTGLGMSASSVDLQQPPATETREEPVLQSLVTVAKFKNVVNAEMLNHLLFLQSTLAKEINDVLEAYVSGDSAREDGKLVSGSTTSTGALPFHYDLTFLLEGVRLVAVGNKRNGAALVIEIDTFDVLLNDRPVTEGNPAEVFLSWKIALQHLTFSLVSPDSVDNIKLGIFVPQKPEKEKKPRKRVSEFGTIVTNVRLQNFQENKSEEHVDLPTQPTSQFWIDINNTHARVRPLAAPKLAALVTEYRVAYNQYQAKRHLLAQPVNENAMRALRNKYKTVASQGEHILSNVSLNLKIVNTRVRVPLVGIGAGEAAEVKIVEPPKREASLVLQMKELSLFTNSQNLAEYSLQHPQGETTNKALGRCRIETIVAYFDEEPLPVPGVSPAAAHHHHHHHHHHGDGSPVPMEPEPEIGSEQHRNGITLPHSKFHLYTKSRKGVYHGWFDGAVAGAQGDVTPLVIRRLKELSLLVQGDKVEQHTVTAGSSRQPSEGSELDHHSVESDAAAPPRARTAIELSLKVGGGHVVLHTLEEPGRAAAPTPVSRGDNTGFTTPGNRRTGRLDTRAVAAVVATPGVVNIPLPGVTVFARQIIEPVKEEPKKTPKRKHAKFADESESEEEIEGETLLKTTIRLVLETPASDIILTPLITTFAAQTSIELARWTAEAPPTPTHYPDGRRIRGALIDTTSQVTVAVHIKPRSFKLTCVPDADLTCHIDVGATDVLLSNHSLSEDTDTLLNTMTVMCPHINLRLHSPSLVDLTNGFPVDLTVRNMQFTQAQYYGYRSADDGDIFLRALVVDAADVKINLQYAREMCMFMALWSDKAGPGRAGTPVSSTTPDSTTQTAVAAAAALLTGSQPTPSTDFKVRIREVGVRAYLGHAIGVVELETGGITLSHDDPGMFAEDPSEPVIVHPRTLAFEIPKIEIRGVDTLESGHLSGTVTLERLTGSLVRTYPFWDNPNTLSPQNVHAPMITLDMQFHKFKIRDLFYKGEQFLLLTLGRTDIQFTDIEPKVRAAEVNPNASASDRALSPRSNSATTAAVRETQTAISLQNLQAYMSRETVPYIQSIVTSVTTLIKEAVTDTEHALKAKYGTDVILQPMSARNDSSMSLQSLQRVASMGGSLAGVDDGFSNQPWGKVSIALDNPVVCIFPSLSAADVMTPWIVFKAEVLAPEFERTEYAAGDRQMRRDLKFDLKKASLAKHSSRDRAPNPMKRMRNSSDQNILSVPSTYIIMNTIVEEPNGIVQYYFNSEFKGSLSPSYDKTSYDFLINTLRIVSSMDTASSPQARYEMDNSGEDSDDARHRPRKKGKKSATSPTLRARRPSEVSSDDGSDDERRRGRKNSNDSRTAASKAKASAYAARFKCHKFQFKPQLDLLGERRMSVVDLLVYLNAAEQDTIPASIYDYIMIPMGSLLNSAHNAAIPVRTMFK